MKRLLLSACLVGVVFVGLPPSPKSMQGEPANEPRNVAHAAPVSGGVLDRAKSQYPGLQHAAFRSSALGALQADGTPVASIDELFAPALPQAGMSGKDAKSSDDARLVDESAMWVVVTRGAWMHSGPSVSSPVVGHQSPGKEMHLVDSQQGWYRVFDPETGQRGWVYAKYYLEPLDRPGQKRVAAVQHAQAPVTGAPVVAAAPSKAVRQVLQQPRFLAPPEVKVEKAASPRARPSGEGVASLLDRAFRR
jgi:hypothetical protein